MADENCVVLSIADLPRQDHSSGIPPALESTLERLIRKVVAEELDKRRTLVQWTGDLPSRMAPTPLPAHNHGGLCCKCSCRNGGSFTSDPALSW